MEPRPPRAWTLVAALCLALAAPVARAAAGPAIAEVKVEGNRRVEAGAVRAAVSKAGAPFDQRKLDADVKALMALGFFDDVQVELEGTNEAPVVVYRLVERPVVKEATIVGNEELSKDDLKDTVEVKPYSMRDLHAIRKDIKKIQEKYVEKGYFLAEVTWKQEQLPDNQIAIRYVVDEKAKVQVREVRFLGNKALSTEQLKGVMYTQEGSLLSGLTSSGTYREDAFQRDLAMLSATYLDEGYVNVKIGKPTVSLSPDKRAVFIAIPVEEGERYTIGKVGFSGELLGEEPRLRALLKSQGGDHFSRSRVGADLTATGDVFKDLGYAYANVSPGTNLDTARRIVDLDFEVQLGPKCRIERIEVAGNEKTRDKVVRRELRIYEGEWFSATGLRNSKARVTALGFFETVEITTRKGSAEDLIVATVEVKEKATGTFQVGAGYSSYEGFILTGQISQQNFLGWGQTLSLQLQWSSLRQLGQLQFVEPYFLDTSWTFAFDVYAQESAYTTFTRRSVGGNLTWGYELSGLSWWLPWTSRLEDMRVFATYKNEYVSVAGTSTTARLYGSLHSGTTSSLQAMWQWDRRDNRLFPTSGAYASLSAEFAPPALAPSSIFGHQINTFTRYNLDLRAYYPLTWGIVARAKASAGLIRAWEKGQEVNISERFYVGGIYSVRGYRFLSIAPQARALCDASQPSSQTCLVALGGNKMGVLNLELEAPLFPSAGIKGVVFFDAGNAFATGQWKNPNGPLLYKSVGLGFRWTSPIGPLRFEWGFPLNRRRDAQGAFTDPSMDFQFTIGNFF